MVLPYLGDHPLKIGSGLRAYDRFVTPVDKAVDRMKLPFGQSLFAESRISTHPG